MNYLIVVDMQNDFVTGSLGSVDAQKIVPYVVDLTKNFDGEIVFTRDTHEENYLRTQEGKNLPVVHCVKGTFGHEIVKELLPYAKSVVDKNSFGSLLLPEYIKKTRDKIENITLCGLCTDICVISNAMILKAAFPETKIIVDAKCTAGVTAESKKTALNAMRAVQIEIINE